MRFIKNGNIFGSHRVISPKGVLPQPAEKINHDVDVLWDNEILIDVDTLNIDSASFAQIKTISKNDKTTIKNNIINIVNSRGKLHNPVTGSGGMLIGKIELIGSKIEKTCDLKIGDLIATLVSLSLTPLKIYEILDINLQTCQVKIKGKAVLFESSCYTKLPDDIPAPLALAILDVCGAPAQTKRIVKPGDTVVILGAGGKSGILCSHEARKKTGKKGTVIGIESVKNIDLNSLNIYNHILNIDACNALLCFETISKITDNKLADVVINCVNVADTELSSVLICKERGTVYFFSMATSFTKAALGAEGMGKDIDMLIGNGYAKGHAKLALNIVRQSYDIRKIFSSPYL